VFDPSPIRQGKAISHKRHSQSRANVYHQTWSREMGETLGWPSQQQGLWDWKYHHPEPHLLLSSANRWSALSGMCCKIIIQTFFSISSHSSWFSCLSFACSHGSVRASSRYPDCWLSCLGNGIKNHDDIKPQKNSTTYSGILGASVRRMLSYLWSFLLTKSSKLVYKTTMQRIALPCAM